MHHATINRDIVADKLVNLAGCFDYPSKAMAQWLEVEQQELESNHIRLFINDRGGVNAPPYAGCYLDADRRRDFMIEFSGICLRHGINPGANQPPDHIPGMLEVLALLLTESGEPAAELCDLLERYYNHWPEAFATALNQHDRDGFYAAAATELQATLTTLHQSMTS